MKCYAFLPVCHNISIIMFHWLTTCRLELCPRLQFYSHGMNFNCKKLSCAAEGIYNGSSTTHPKPMFNILWQYSKRRIESKGPKWPRYFKSHDSTLLPLSSMCSCQSNTLRWLLTTQSHFSCIKKGVGPPRHCIFPLVTDSTPAFAGFLCNFKTEVTKVCETL